MSHDEFRRFLTAAGVAFGIVLAAWLGSPAARAQKLPQSHRLGLLFVGRPLQPDAPPPDFSKESKELSPAMRAFMAPIAEHGHLVGKNLAVELRVGEYEQLPALAAELERHKVDVIFTAGTKTARIVQRTVKTTPLVIYSCDPFEHVRQLARPGGNLTGSTCMTSELSPKRLELLKELLPKASDVVFFGDPDDAPVGWQLTRELAPKLGVRLRSVAYKGREGIADGLRAVARERPDAVFVYPDAILVEERGQIAEIALTHHLPTMHAFPEMAEAGGLMSYGADTVEMFAMLGEQVAQILDGARPSEVPVRRAMRFHLVINLKTAKELGVTVPRSLLLRADRLIE